MRRHALSGVGGVLVGLVLVVVGIYYVFTNTLGIDLPELKADMVWPFLVIGIGVAIVYRATNDRLGQDRP